MTSDVTQVSQPVTDDSIQVRELSHYQFSWVAQEPGGSGVITLQLVLDQGAWEEVLTPDVEDADRAAWSHPVVLICHRHSSEAASTRARTPVTPGGVSCE
jgi:predicted amidohydrolase YtcJ